MRKYLSFILLLIGLTLQAQETYKTVKDISYIPAGETDGYRKERCKLDVYYPVGKKGCKSFYAYLQKHRYPMV